MDQPIRNLWARLRRRKIVQWTAVYAAGAWLLVQVADTIGPRWGLTEGLARTLDVLLVVGFVAALIIAWYHGEKGRQQVGTMEMLMLGALLVIGGAALELVQREPAETPVDSVPVEPAESADPAKADRMTVAVLPFDNYSPNPDDTYFASGITEEITSQLAKIGDLTVLSRVAVERAISSGDSLNEIAASLGAGTVLEGSVRMAGDQVRITAQLIDMSNHQHLWAENYDRELKDIFGIQTEVALAIGDALLAELSSGERSRIEKAPTENVRAYQLYLRSMSLSGSNPSKNQEAIGLLEQALELDPQFALARARLAWRYVWQHRLFGERDMALKAEALALEALEQDPDLGYGYYALGSAYGELDRHGPLIEAFERAYELDPNNLSVLNDGSMLEASTGSIELALEMAFRSVQLDPNSANIRWHAVMPLLMVGDEERTEAWLDLAAKEGLAMHRLDITRAMLDMMRGDTVQATENLFEVRTRYRENPEAQFWTEGLLVVLDAWQTVRNEILATAGQSPNVRATPIAMPRSLRTVAAFIRAESGDRETALSLFEETRAVNREVFAQGQTTFARWVEEAAIHAYLGEADEALADLERGIALGYVSDWALRVDPMFAALRDDTRFEALLGQIEELQRQRMTEALNAGAFDSYDRMLDAGPP